MFKQRYTYNPETCHYEPHFMSGKKVRNRLLLMFCFAFLLASACYYFYLQTGEAIDLVQLKQSNRRLKSQWALLQDEMKQQNTELQKFIAEDDQLYRPILEADTLAKTQRLAGVGGTLRIPEEVKDYPIIENALADALQMKHELTVEYESFEQLQKLVNTKTKQWASRPAIQPIDNQDLVFLYGTFGMRLNPVLGIYRLHKGLDFKAKTGTPIYATGDGEVLDAYYSDSYGNVVYIHHGFGFETRYAHMLRFIVNKGEKVKRGQVIGYVGNTGTSAGEHLHYEVLHRGQHINPIHFFQRDLSNQEYQKLLDLAKNSNTTLD
ncbi:MAG: M23 family metallopeptidase [Cyclobacteriaceae bacterium]|jgi:murein DD-endopeptidase MepM/ murein hydrolase activator NlpD|nr:M23 family metallopeptidase [Cyclobacteriaceae bacterium]